MPFNIDIKIDTKRFLIMTNRELKKQVEFGVLKGINDTAFALRKAAQAQVRQDLNITRQFLPQSITVDKATKQRLIARIGFLPRAWMVPLLQEGGRRIPVSSRFIAIPSDKGVKRSKTGGITKANRPRALSGRKDTFIADLTGKGPAMYRRLRNGTIQLLYDFESSTTYDPRQIKFTKVAESVISKFLTKNIVRQINKALATARL